MPHDENVVPRHRPERIDRTPRTPMTPGSKLRKMKSIQAHYARMQKSRTTLGELGNAMPAAMAAEAAMMPPKQSGPDFLQKPASAGEEPPAESIAAAAPPEAAFPQAPAPAPQPASLPHARDLHAETESLAGSVNSGGSRSSSARTVARLRPVKPVTVKGSSSLFEVARAMKNKRQDVALLVDEDNRLQGILTANDFVKRVIARGTEPSTTRAEEVMTRSPRCVSHGDSAIEALSIMAEGRFRHLPVVDGRGVVNGVLDITKCLYDAIHRMETAAARQASKADAIRGAVLRAVATAASSEGAAITEAAAVQKMIAPLMGRVFGGAGNAAVGSLLDEIDGCSSLVCVEADCSVRDACVLMAAAGSGKAALVVGTVRGGDRGIVGIVTPKDAMNRMVARGLDADRTSVRDIMTENPDSIAPEATVLDAMHQMLNNRYLHLPVVSQSPADKEENDGGILGCVDVMDIVHKTIAGGDAEDDDGGASGREALQRFLHSAFSHEGAASEYDHGSECQSQISEDVGSTLTGTVGTMGEALFTFKVTDADGATHRVRCPYSTLGAVREALCGAMGVAEEAPSAMRLMYTDCDGDNVILACDETLVEAVDQTRRAGLDSLKLRFELPRPKAPPAGAPAAFTPLAGAVAVMGAAALLGGLYIVSRKR